MKPRSSSRLVRWTPWVSLVFALLLLGGPAGPVRAGPVIGGGTLSETVVHIEVSANGQTAEHAFAFDPGLLIGGQYVCGLPEALDLCAGNNDVLATIQSLQVEYDLDPAVDLGFYVSAGQQDTTFRITSATVTFDPITDPEAYASAAVTVTDGGGGGGRLTGLFDDTRAYQARTDLGTFADLVGQVDAPADSSASADDRYPSSGWATINGQVSSIESEFHFTLTADDHASGSSKFEVVPEPATMGLLGFGLALLVGSRRRR